MSCYFCQRIATDEVREGSRTFRRHFGAGVSPPAHFAAAVSPSPFCRRHSVKLRSRANCVWMQEAQTAYSRNRFKVLGPEQDISPPPFRRGPPRRRRLAAGSTRRRVISPTGRLADHNLSFACPLPTYASARTTPEASAPNFDQKGELLVYVSKGGPLGMARLGSSFNCTYWPLSQM